MKRTHYWQQVLTMLIFYFQLAQQVHDKLVVIQSIFIKKWICLVLAISQFQIYIQRMIDCFIIPDNILNLLRSIEKFVFLCFCFSPFPLINADNVSVSILPSNILVQQYVKLALFVNLYLYCSRHNLVEPCGR